MPEEIIPRFEPHSHDCYSNLRLLDSTNRPETLVRYAYDIGLKGIAVTNHESLSNFVILDKLQEEYREIDDTFKIVRGNEIYLTDTRDKGQYYYHHILLALDSVGNKMLRELSSNAWINSYYDRGMERVPTLKSEVRDIIKKYGKGHLHASSACLAGQINHNLNMMIQAEQIGDANKVKEYHDNLVEFILWCIDTYGEDNFTLEVAPGRSDEQLAVNSRMTAISQAFGLPIVIGTDAHYLKKEDRFVHKAFLNSKEGEREVDSFYQYAYLQTQDEIIGNLAGTGLDYSQLCANSMRIYDKCEYYTLAHKQQVPQVSVPDFPKKKVDIEQPTLREMYESNNPQERYWVNYCVDELKKRKLDTKEYYDRLEYEADIMSYVGKELDTCIFAYPIFFKHYMDLIWDCGSPIGVARGSAASGLNHYLFGITQINPVTHDFAYWRFLNKSRVELPDIDVDLSPTKRPTILNKIREERGQLGCVQVCTFGTVTSKSAVKTACRGLGVDLETAEYLSSLIPQERGFVWSISETYYGNPDKKRKRVKNFVDEVNRHEGLLEVMLGIEGLVNRRGIHASGVNFYDDDPYKTACFMKAKDGSIITQYDLHDTEFCGDVKIDMLVTEQMDIIAQCLQMLQEHGYIDKGLSLREAYDKTIHPDVLPMQDDKLWDAIDSTDILALFQLNSQVGSQAVKKLLPRDIKSLNDVNGIMRLMASDDGEMPIDRYARIKANPQAWVKEMNSYGLTKDEQNVIREYITNGVLIDQECLMRIVMDKRTCGFSLSESNSARKIVAKKHMDKIEELHQQILDRSVSPAMGKYLWLLLQPSMGYSFNYL